MIREKLNILWIGLMISTSLQAQKLYYSVDRLRQQNVWLGSDNAAALTTYNFDDFTQAEVAACTLSGKYRQAFDAQRDNSYSLTADSYKRLNKVVVYGHFLFDYDWKKEQSWSSMTFPGSTPLHIADVTPGDQLKESYGITGGIGVPLGKGWSVGGQFDFLYVANSKKKDVRNQNQYSRYAVSPSLMYQVGAFRIGASYRGGRETEGISWKLFGDAKQHQLYYFEGLWFGKNEAYSSSIDNRRYETSHHTGSLQLGLVSSDIQFLNQFSLGRDKQHVYLKVEKGERGGEMENARYAYQGQLVIDRNSFSHIISGSVNHDFMKSYQNLQQQEMVNHIYQFVQYGRLNRYTSSDWNTNVSYDLYRNREGLNSSWHLGVEAGYLSQTERFRVYPQIYCQKISQTFGALLFDKNFSFTQGMLDLGFRAVYTFGTGDELATENQEVVTPDYISRPDIQQYQFGYLTANHVAADLWMKYTYFVKPETGMSAYAKVAYGYDRVTDGTFKSDHRMTCRLAIGLNF